MAEGIDDVRDIFAKELPAATRPKDQAGKFVQVSRNPEPMFAPRPIEGDERTGDTRDGGDDPRLSANERSVRHGANQGNGRSTVGAEREDSQSISDQAAERGSAGSDDRHGLQERPGDRREPEEQADNADYDLAESDAGTGAEGPSERDAQGEELERGSGERYEVVVDGERYEITLEEALRGWQREATFHQRLNAVEAEKQKILGYENNLQTTFQAAINMAQRYVKALENMLPQINWDEAYAVDPKGARVMQKNYEDLLAKRNKAFSDIEMAAQAAESVKKQAAERYALDGFQKFVIDNGFKSEDELKREIRSMRRTGYDAGFNEQELVTVFDPRMLTVLRWASLYRRAAASRPKAVRVGKSPMAPGSATPLSGNAARKGLDDALRRQAQSGRIDDTVEVFRRML